MGIIPSPRLSRFDETFFIAGGLQGCSFMFNKEIANIAKRYEGYMVMHDFLLTLVTLAFGSLVYVENKLMLYRQEHEEKATKNVSNESVLYNRFPVIDGKHYQSLVNFVEQFYPELSESQKEKYQEFIRFYKANSLMKRITIILKNKFSLRNSTIILIIKMLIRPIK